MMYGREETYLKLDHNHVFGKWQLEHVSVIIIQNSNFTIHIEYISYSSKHARCYVAF